ncbi:MAG: ABC transporter substrate-binding protein [Actinobacteria bacterium]|nr:ABC transporter substrate-binding protein [Actinomycetota bacterium]MCL5887244.1 ABC transporter substrate-binding protein [Actinomycetota bacterium]
MRSRSSKWLVAALGAVLVAAMLFATGCAPQEQEPAPPQDEVQRGGTLSFYISEPAFIDPFNLQESEGTQVGQALFDSLVSFDPITSEIIPAAAASWESNEDATVWTFNLVEGATFHNGREVTAADFKFAWERIVNPENQSEISYHLSAVEGFEAMASGAATELAGVRVVDDLTLEVTLSYAFADFEFVVGHPALAPVPREEVEPDPAAFGAMPIGNGPFRMSEPWARDQFIRIERFEDYYGTAPNIDAVDFRILADMDTAFLEFQAGNLDFTRIPSGQIDATVDQYGRSPDGYTANPGEQVLLGNESATYYLLMNNTQEVFQNPQVREALSLAINRQAICDIVFEGTRTPASGIVPPGIVGFTEDAWENSRYDVDAAKAALEEAGFPNGDGLPPIVLEYNSGAGHEDILQLVQSDFAAIGIESELKGMEWAAYLDRLAERTYQMGRLGWVADYPIMDNFLYPLFKSGSSDNFAGYTNPEVDRMLEQARKTVDDAERIALYQEIEAAIGADMPVIPLMYYSHTRVASERVRDGVMSPKGLFAFESVWLAQ